MFIDGGKGEDRQSFARKNRKANSWNTLLVKVFSHQKAKELLKIENSEMFEKYESIKDLKNQMYFLRINFLRIQN